MIILQEIHVSNRIVYLKLIQCYIPIMFQQNWKNENRKEIVRSYVKARFCVVFRS